MTPASFSRRQLANVSDAAIFLSLMIGITALLSYYRPGDYSPGWRVIVFFILFRAIALLLGKVTPGMRLLKIVLRNGDMQALSTREKLLAAAGILYRGTNYYTMPSPAEEEH